MELDVKMAVHWWLVSSGRNFGLSVEVEDAEGRRRPANRYFKSSSTSSTSAANCWQPVELGVGELLSLTTFFSFSVRGI